jgi:hypothetical protein
LRTVRNAQVLGLALLVAGCAFLFFLRGPLFSFLVALVNLIGIVIGLLLVVAGLALLLGGRWGGRRGWWGDKTFSLHSRDR